MIYPSYYYDFELQGRLRDERKNPPQQQLRSEYCLTCRLSPQVKKQLVARDICTARCSARESAALWRRPPGRTSSGPFGWRPRRSCWRRPGAGGSAQTGGTGSPALSRYIGNILLPKTTLFNVHFLFSPLKVFTDEMFEGTTGEMWLYLVYTGAKETK